MCNGIPHRNPIHCILPPYILRKIAENGDTQQTTDALQTISNDTTFRNMRTFLAAAGEPATRAMSLTATREKQRTIFDARHGQNLPGSVVRAEGEPASGDVAVDEAYDGLGATYDFFSEVYDRNSIDDDGMPLNATVHFGMGYNNAFWNGQQMIFGDGDGDLFNRFTIAVDVIGHELVHGVTQDEAQLIYFNQSGSLNESMSDVMGSLVKQYLLNQKADEADWLIGAGLFTNRVNGVALRSMKEPGTAFDDSILGKDPQPAHMKHFVRTFEDNGGVHINSGIPNRAFYLAAVSIGGYAWEKAGRVWYEALRDPRLRPNATFRRFAQLTLTNAKRLYGVRSSEQKAIREAWKAVGIKLS